MNKIHDIQEEVAIELRRKVEKLIEELEDNLAIVMTSDIKKYNADWCGEENHKSIEAKETAVNNLVNAELEVLFGNAPKDN